MDGKAMQVRPPTVSWSFWPRFLSKRSLGFLPFSSCRKAQALLEDTTTLPREDAAHPCQPEAMGKPWGGQFPLLGCSQTARRDEPTTLFPGCRSRPGLGPEDPSSLAQRSWGPRSRAWVE